jgi:hypothetical protein
MSACGLTGALVAVCASLSTNRDEGGWQMLSASLSSALDQTTGLARRGGRVVDRVALEMRSTGNRTGGSNPSLSAICY